MRALEALATARKRYGDDERGVEQSVIDLLRAHDLVAEMGWPDIAAIRRQQALGRAISDLVLEHTDGSITVIEVKRHGLHLRDYCTGVGQLAYQGSMAALTYGTPNVRKVLALPGPVALDVVILCEAAGVDILPTPTPDQMVAAYVEASLAKAA